MFLLKKIILYYPFKLKDQTTGSSVRPVKMIEAFEKLANDKQLELIKITGEKSERLIQLDKLYTSINPKDIEMCYMENVNIPLWLTDQDHIPRKPLMDIRFFKYLKKNNIPLGVFYRDVYWKFNDLYKVKPVVKQMMQWLFNLELNNYKKFADVLFLPSMYMNEYVGFDKRKVVALPPGGTDLVTDNTRGGSSPISAIYVGGVHPRYGVYDMLKAFNSLNNQSIKIKLTLVCRKHEFLSFNELFLPYLNKEWLSIHHASGEELKEYYKMADFGIVPLKKDVYNDFAVAVKLFEYLSYGLPVISTDCQAQKDIVMEDQIGIVVNDNWESIYNGLCEMLEDEKRAFYQNNAVNALRSKHLWIHRAEEAYNSLVKK